ncbi:MAG: hypothetical protein AAF843_16930, partial [Bacteroidota bacterium]
MMAKKVLNNKWVFGVFMFLFLACSSDEPNEVDQREGTGLQYFGFTLVDTYWDDPTDAVEKINYID